MRSQDVMNDFDQFSKNVENQYDSMMLPPSKSETPHMNKIKELISQNKVMVFSKAYCGFCHMAQSILKEKGIAFKAVEMDKRGDGAAMHSCLKGYSGHRTVPNIYINGTHIGGYDQLEAGFKNGKIEKMLGNKPVEKPRNKFVVDYKTPNRLRSISSMNT